MTRWLFDLGNTRLKCAPLDDHGRIGDMLAIEHDGADLAVAIERLPMQSADVAYVASVAAAGLRLTLLQALAARCSRISIACTTRRWGGLQVAYADPSRLGVDRFLAMLAVHADASAPALVCGVGTALTIDLLDAGGCHRGGCIAPSPTLMREALHGRASQLPSANGEYREFADDTLDALTSGCQGAALGLIERSLQQAGRELGQAPALVLHGGGAAALVTHLPHARLAPALVLEGLARWAAVECERG